jgi:hypothetical protein
VERANACGTKPDEPPDTGIQIYRAKSTGRLLGEVFGVFKERKAHGCAFRSFITSHRFLDDLFLFFVQVLLKPY